MRTITLRLDAPVYDLLTCRTAGEILERLDARSWEELRSLCAVLACDLAGLCRELRERGVAVELERFVMTPELRRETDECEAQVGAAAPRVRRGRRGGAGAECPAPVLTRWQGSRKRGKANR